MEMTRENFTTLLEAALEGRVETLNSLIEQDPLILHKASLARENLLEAASEGRVETLNSLIEQDPLFLLITSVTTLSGKPLHVSSLMGNLNFTRAILNRHPNMASELDAYKRSPLHLASAKGHAEIVEALLQVNDSICLDRDEDGRIPLHLAAMRGRTEVIRKLISAKLDSINLELHGDTALHLCVRYNHLDALKILVEMIDDKELINKGNKQGNTILHLATQLRHAETLEYLISEPKVLASTGDTVNKLGFKACDILEHDPRDLKTMEIRRILNSRKENIAKRWFRKLMHFLDCQGNWLQDMRGALMIVATVIATISFQVTTNPPGGVSQDDKEDKGKAVLSSVYPYEYNKLVIYNTVAFMASVSIILLIITGFPLQNKLFMWFLTLAMGTAVTSLAMTYLISLQMISPDIVFSVADYFEDLNESYNVQVIATLFWLGLLILVGAINTIRFLYWVGKKLNEILHTKLSKFRTERKATASGPRQEHRISTDV